MRSRHVTSLFLDFELWFATLALLIGAIWW